MKDSVVIPAKNEAEHITITLHDVLYMKPDAEIVVVSNGSTDDTVKLAKECGVKVLEYSWSNLSKARNIGFQNTSGERITFLDADTRPEIEYFKKLDTLDFNGYDLIYPRLHAKEPGWAFHYWVYHLFCLSPLPTATGGCITVLRDRFKGFNEDIPFWGEDHHLTKTHTSKYTPSLHAYTDPIRLKAGQGRAKNMFNYLRGYTKTIR